MNFNKQSFILIVIGFVTSSYAGASGNLPIYKRKETFASHAACIARLEKLHQDNLANAKVRNNFRDGSVQRYFLKSKGIETISNTQSKYEFLFVVQNLLPFMDKQQVEIVSSYEQREYDCVNEIMTISGSNGFTLPTFSTWEQEEALK
jgi:hypothetical protein